MYKTFKIFRNTAYRWLKKYKETGNLERSPGSGKKPKIDDLKKFKKIVDENPDSTQKELGQLYGGASQLIVCRAIKKNGYTYKKKTSAYKERDKVKRKRFITLLLKILSKYIVYIDETSFDNGAKYMWGYAKKGECCIVKETSRASDRRTVVAAVVAAFIKAGGIGINGFLLKISLK